MSILEENWVKVINGYKFESVSKKPTQDNHAHLNCQVASDSFLKQGIHRRLFTQNYIDLKKYISFHSSLPSQTALLFSSSFLWKSTSWTDRDKVQRLKLDLENQINWSNIPSHPRVGIFQIYLTLFNLMKSILNWFTNFKQPNYFTWQA